MTAADAFEKWWQSVKLGGFMNDEITQDHVREAFDLGTRLEREACAKLAESIGSGPYSSTAGWSLSERIAKAIRNRTP